MKAHPKIVVVGSLNVDHTFRVTHFPAPGDTRTASGASTDFGGKGANQALAAARAGGRVSLIGCVGDDELGTRYLEYLQGEGILTEAIIRSPPSVPTGTAFIVVDDQGENLIVVNPGANHALHPQHIDAHSALIRTADALLLQLECPLTTVMRAAEIAREAGVPVILNPSPLTPEFIHSGMKVHTLIVNEHEEREASAWIASNGHTPLAARCEQLIITAGPKPTRAVTPTQSISLHPPHVTPADTTGAGDTFAGAFAVALTEGQPLAEALAFANAAGALATLLPGAQTAIPRREEIMEFMKSQEGG
jgi:ribokinase